MSPERSASLKVGGLIGNLVFQVNSVFSNNSLGEIPYSLQILFPQENLFQLLFSLFFSFFFKKRKENKIKPNQQREYSTSLHFSKGQTVYYSTKTTYILNLPHRIYTIYIFCRIVVYIIFFIKWKITSLIEVSIKQHQKRKISTIKR